MTTFPRSIPPRSYEWAPPPPPGALRELAIGFVVTCMFLTVATVFIGRSLVRKIR